MTDPDIASPYWDRDKRSSAVNASAPTPGPWAVGTQFAERCGGRTYIPILRPGNDPVPIAVVHRDVDGYGRGEGEANARLIAALPDLMKEIERLQALVNAQLQPGCDAPQLDRVFIGKGEYVSAEQATKTIMDLQRNLRHWREECGKLHAKLASALPSPDGSAPASQERQSHE